MLAFHLLIHPLRIYILYIGIRPMTASIEVASFEQSVQYEWTAAELHKAASSPSKAKQAKSGTEIKHCHSEI